MSSTLHDRLPDKDGWIPLVANGRLWARYHPGRNKLHIKDGDKQAYFNLGKYQSEAGNAWPNMVK